MSEVRLGTLYKVNLGVLFTADAYADGFASQSGATAAVLGEPNLHHE